MQQDQVRTFAKDFGMHLGAVYIKDAPICRILGARTFFTKSRSDMHGRQANRAD